MPVTLIYPDETVDPRSIADDELVAVLRKAAGIWFRNRDLLLLEELIRRYYVQRSQKGT